jgi:hypothetical protein
VCMQSARGERLFSTRNDCRRDLHCVCIHPCIALFENNARKKQACTSGDEARQELQAHKHELQYVLQAIFYYKPRR